ncbi:ankyrin repeat-containing domain protein [Lasiosphaeria hispida]|uniref:Ankyrin repeat-containing domain protein n=1 Tax=Lasiosphaeria hispida TaxID=260671 RepID=A0AAJ0HCA6_9PEZI|nr:ankyrin repeat-containing domain protein [Lasiosphaeria hispida]
MSEGTETFSGIHVAAQFGLDQYLPKLPVTVLEINSTAPRGVTPLMRAAGNRHGKVVEWLLKEGADVDAYDGDRKSALHYAVMSKCKTSLGLLLQHGSRAMNADYENLTPIHHAVREFEEGLEMILDAGFSVNTTAKRSLVDSVDRNDAAHKPIADISVAKLGYDECPVGLTPLHYAVLLGRHSMVERLLQRGADPSILSLDGESALHIAVACDLQKANDPFNGFQDGWNDRQQRIECFLDDFYDFFDHDEAGEEAYNKVLANIKETRTAILKAILGHPKTNVNAQESVHGSSPLHFKCDPEWTILLLDAGANPSLRDHQGRTPLHLACLDTTHYRAAILLHFGASVFDTDDKGRNVAHYTASGGSLRTLELILEKARGNGDPIVQSRDIRGRTPLHYVAEGSEFNFDSSDALSLLLRNGAGINDMVNDGATPLAILLSKACFIWANEKLLKGLLGGGAIVSYTTADGRGLGHLYAEACHEMKDSVLEQLESFGLELRATDNDGRTILHQCATSGSLSVKTLRYLAGAGVDVGLKDRSGKTALDLAKEEARKKHNSYTCSCYRWRRTEELLSCWMRGGDVSWLEKDNLGACPPKLHTFEPIPLGRNRMEIGIKWD